MKVSLETIDFKSSFLGSIKHEHVKGKQRTSVKKALLLSCTKPNGDTIKLKLVSGFLSVLVFLLCFLNGIVYYYIHTESEYVNGGLLDSNIKWFTIPCDNVSLSLDEDEDTFDSSKHTIKFYQNTDGKYICSFTNLTEIVVKVSERHARLRLAEDKSVPGYLSCGNIEVAPKPGHLTASFTQLSKHQLFKGRNQIIHWDYNHDQSFLGPGLKYDNGTIQVNETRYYFIYAAVTFDQSIKDTRDCGSCMFTLSIYTANPLYSEYETRQLYNSHMLCRKYGTSTNYVGAHVYMERDDIVYIKVTDANRLQSSGNVYGIFPMT